MWWVILLATLGGLVLLATLALCVPVDLVLSWDSSAPLRFEARMEWLFGLVHREFFPKSKSVASMFPVGKQLTDIPTVIRILRTRGLPGKTKRLLQEILARIRIKEAAVNLRFGLGDPADTGLLFAVIVAGMPLLKLLWQYPVIIEPDFGDSIVFEGKAHALLRLQPIRLAIPFGRFIFSRPGRQVTRTLILARWRRRN